MHGFNPCRVFSFAATEFDSASDTGGACFNPCRVFSFAATPLCPVFHLVRLLCFNPCRVFSFAATQPQAKASSRWTGFNPCRVFSFAATIAATARRIAFSKFQSLSGFLVRCDNKIIAPPTPIKVVSIPVGFSRSLRLSLSSIWGFVYEGFNPCRVFSFAATQKLLKLIEGPTIVSIPVGFSRSLRPAGFLPQIYDNVKFQSLSGFLVRCDGKKVFQLWHFSQFQSLSGFLVRCDYRDTLTGYVIIMFQSLSGFLVRCDSMSRAGWHANALFQSLSGFLVRCDRIFRCQN